MTRLLALLALAGCLVFTGVGIAAEHGAPKKAEKSEKKAPPKAAEKKAPPPPAAEGGEGKIGYSDEEIQLNGMMVPIKTRNGKNYEVVTLRLQLAPTEETRRPACWMAPIVHEKFLMYLHDANLSEDDFVGQKRELLARALLDVAIKTTDKSYYSGVVLVDETSPPLAQKSITLSSQCK
ncbi:MAG: hypothetical protein K1X51_16290 [Rhodospirillaceae bacterium]|nr:hypothetical protein [Rhodospirillaceae bacterium]